MTEKEFDNNLQQVCLCVYSEGDSVEREVERVCAFEIYIYREGERVCVCV